MNLFIRRFFFGSLLLLAGCAQEPLIPPPLAIPPSEAQAKHPPPQLGESHETHFERVDGPALVTPAPSKAPAAAASSAPVQNPPPGVSLNFDQMTLPGFIQLVYGEILRKNVQIDPKVAERKDLVTLRSGGVQSPEEIEKVVKQVLLTYGLAVVEAGGLVRVIPDSANMGYLPEIRRGSALPDSPAQLRPQFYLIELKNVRQSEVTSWIKTMFGERLKVIEDPGRNAIVLGGAPDTLRSAMDAIAVLDQPTLAGRKSLRIAPQFWSAEDLAKRLYDMLTAEGYTVQPVGQAMSAGMRYPVILMPVPAVNEVYAFAAASEVLDHVQAWAQTLDQPSGRGMGRNFFVYAAQNVDASSLAKTVTQLLGGGRGLAGGTGTSTSTNTSTSTGSASGGSGRTTGTNTGTTSAGSSGSAGTSYAPGVVVDQATNTLIFQGNAEDYPQIRSLLATLDRPAKQVLIEVTVAELQLTGSWALGVEWAFSSALKNGNTSSGGTVGGLSLGTSGFTYQLLGSASQVRAAFNAVASDNRATILSSPRIMARNGELASIEVGQEVPIITSQQTSLAAATTTQTGVLQTVEYRTTGVILKVKPVVHSSEQVELEVTQEVSAAESTTTGVNNSPTFSTRKVATSLSLKNGDTVMLGGLISGNTSTGDSGVPILKDIPLLGNLFRTTNASKDRTEVIVLITPYVINDDFDAHAVTDAFRKQLGNWANTPPIPGQNANPAAAVTPPQVQVPPPTKPEGDGRP